MPPSPQEPSLQWPLHNFSTYILNMNRPPFPPQPSLQEPCTISLSIYICSNSKCHLLPRSPGFNGLCIISLHIYST